MNQTISWDVCQNRISEDAFKVTSVSRGRAMGVTQQLLERDRYLYRREYMLDRLAMMGGRDAEHLVLDTAIVDESYERATGILQEHRQALDRLTETLLEGKEIPGERVLELVGTENENASSTSNEGQDSIEP